MFGAKWNSIAIGRDENRSILDINARQRASIVNQLEKSILVDFAVDIDRWQRWYKKRCISNSEKMIF